ncbi:hypothetical protein [Moraxella macacae]|nr:hypothetical protein [Moraxella macacae]
MLKSLSSGYRSLALQVAVWLLFAGIAGGLTFMVWVASAVKPAKKIKQNDEVAAVIDPNILLVNHNPDEMHKLVRPISFDAIVRDKRNYPKEFKDSSFLKANVGKWTLQVMNVVQHEVITDYLNGRSDREKFSYFRIVDTNNEKRFVLTYGVFTSPQEAIGTSKIINFGLPNNVQAFLEEINRYTSQMDEYEIMPPLEEIGKQAPKSVNLKEVQQELPAPTTDVQPTQPKKSIEKSTNTDDTLVIEEQRKVINPNEPDLPIPIISKQHLANRNDNIDNHDEPMPKQNLTKNTNEQPVKEPKSKQTQPKLKEETKPKEEKISPKPNQKPKEKTTTDANPAEKAE